MTLELVHLGGEFVRERGWTPHADFRTLQTRCVNKDAARFLKIPPRLQKNLWLPSCEISVSYTLVFQQTRSVTGETTHSHLVAP